MKTNSKSIAQSAQMEKIRLKASSEEVKDKMITLKVVFTNTMVKLMFDF